MSEIKDFFSVIEYAALLNIHPNTVRRSIKMARISAFRVGAGKRSDYRIPRAEISRMAFTDLEKVVQKMVEARLLQAQKQEPPETNKSHNG